MVYVLLSLAPIILTTFGALFLNEKVRWRRWTAVILGFAGVVIVINPGELRFGYFFIFPLLSAILLSFRDMYTKKIEGNFYILQIAFIILFLGYIFSVATIKVALVSVTSTFRYSVIIWGILYGYFYFNEIPNTNTYIGAIMIVISGLIIISRQKHLGKIK